MSFTQKALKIVVKLYEPFASDTYEKQEIGTDFFG